MEAKKPLDKRVLVIAVIGLAIIIGLLCYFLFFRDDGAGDTPRLGYAADATMADSGNELQEIADRITNDNGVTLEYSNAAVSPDGKSVTCYIANAAENQYDMYFGVYFDADFADELYLSQLLRPGTALREIELSRTLAPGNYQVYVVETQVGEVDGRQTIMNQTAHTVDLQVKE